MGFEKLFNGDLVEIRPPKNTGIKFITDIFSKEKYVYGLIPRIDFEHKIIGIVVAEGASSDERRDGFRYWTMIFTYNCKILWFPTKHIVLRKRGSFGENKCQHTEQERTGNPM